VVATLRALLAGGSADTCETLRLTLRVRWPDLDLVHKFGADEALEVLTTQNPHILLACPDGTLPQWPDFIAQVRATSDVPLVLLSEDSSPMDRIRAFELGADDWLPSGCLPMEFIAKLNAILRRRNGFSGDCWTCGRLKIHLRHHVEVGGRPVRLSPREYRILCHLAEHSESPVSPDELLRCAWGHGYDGDFQLLRKSIRRLRQKLADEPPELILNERGTGYLLAAPCTPTNDR
jgi:DNA-binding response OmpR family regulator